MSFLWNHFLFSDFNKFVSTANRRDLNEGDIWGLGENHRAYNIHQKWTHKNSCSYLCNKTGLALLNLLGSEVLISGLYEVFHILFTLTNPIALKMLMDYIEKGRGDYLGGIYSIIFLTLTGFLASLCETHTFYHLNLSGFKMKTALMIAIYKKSLRVPTFNGGNVISLVSVDCQWLIKAIRFIHLPWSCPLQIIIAIYLLYDILGVAIIPGIIIIFILIGISFLLSLLLQKFQKAHLKKKDVRLSRIMEALGHFKTIKLNSWEESITNKIGTLRRDEISAMKKFLTIQALQVFLWNCGIFIFSFSAFATFSFYSPQMSVQSIFVSAALVNTMRIPFRLLPSCISALSQGLVSIRRIDSFLNREEVDSVTFDNANSKPPAKGYSIQVQNCSYSIDKLKLLRNISFSTKTGELTAVVGKVGSGKSCLLAAICGELNRRGSGTVFVDMDVVYVTQNIWLKTATIRENILFGRSYNSSKYRKVVSMCGLTEDFKNFYNGDLTFLSSNGVTLSGGQRQRIGFARAIYRNAQVYLLDDPLSACDSKLKAKIFYNTIGPRGILQKKTRLFITNQSSLIPLMDRILVLQGGSVAYEGTYHQFKSHFPSVNEFLQPDDNAEAVSDEDVSLDTYETIQKNEPLERQSSFQDTPKDCYLHPILDNYDIIERRKIPFSLYKYYVINLGSLPFMIALVGYLISQGFDVASKLWLSRWTNLSSTNNNNTNGTNFDHVYDDDTRNMYIIVYGILGCCQSLAYFLSVLLINSRSLRASSHFHSSMLNKVFGAPLDFFWSTPKGTIMNRFSKDMDEADMFLPNTLKNFAYQAVKILGTIAIALIAFPITAFFIVCPLGLIFIEVVKSYLMASRFLKRTSATKLAMLLKHFGDSAVNGAPTIRCFGVEPEYLNEHLSLIDDHQSVSLMEIISEAWLFLRLQLIAGTFIGILATALVFFPAEGNSNSLSALSLTSSLTVLQDIFLFTRYAAFIEKAMVSIERIKECEDLIPQDNSSGLLPSVTPNGTHSDQIKTTNKYIHFQDFTGRYSALKKSSLKSFNLTVGLGDKIGIIGRTGSGKSSFILALSGLLEVEKGKVMINGVDMSTGFARSVRKKDMTVIPQDAALFRGSIRQNLDPEDELSDEQIWSAIQEAQLKHFFSNLPGGLDFHLKENGSNISLGEKQMICCLRGLLSGSNIIILDEATSAMTLEQEERIIQSFFKSFPSSTIFIIGHRIKPLLSCHKILTLVNGTIGEFGSTESLLKSKKSLLRSMLHYTTTTTSLVKETIS